MGELLLDSCHVLGRIGLVYENTFVVVHRFVLCVHLRFTLDDYLHLLTL